MKVEIKSKVLIVSKTAHVDQKCQTVYNLRIRNKISGQSVTHKKKKITRTQNLKNKKFVTKLVIIIWTHLSNHHQTFIWANVFCPRTRGHQRSTRSTSRAAGAFYHLCPVLLSEIRRRGSKDLLKVCLLVEGSEVAVEGGQQAPPQIYDVPYEGCRNTEKTAISRPELDLRPSIEYELPWEWKKEHIVKTLSGTFDI